MASYQIRFGNLNDVDLITPLFDQYRQFYGEPPQPIPARAFLRDRLVQGESQIIVAESGPDIIGFTQLFPSFSSVTLQRLWVLNDLYVDAAHRGNGVGRALLRAAAEFGRQAGAKQLFIEGAVANKSARGLYEDFGFVKNSDYVYYHLPLTRPSYQSSHRTESNHE